MWVQMERGFALRDAEGLCPPGCRGALPGSLPKAEPLQNSPPSTIAAHPAPPKPPLDPFVHTHATWQEKAPAWANIITKKANGIAQVGEEPLAAGKGYKNIITLTSIPQAAWADEDPGQAASWGNGLVLKRRLRAQATVTAGLGTLGPALFRCEIRPQS